MRISKKWLIYTSIIFITILGVNTGADHIYANENTEEDPIFKKDTISTVNIELDEADFQDMLDNPLEEAYKAGTVTYNGVEIAHTGVRVKGNSSLKTVAESDSDRYSFKLKFDKYMDQDLFGYTKINLNNNFADPSYMREYLTYELLADMGLETPNYSFVNVSINGEYYGLYLAIENFEEAYLERNFGDVTGNLYKADSGASLTWKDGMDVDDTGLVLKTGSEKQSNLLSFIQALNNGENIADYFDVDKYLRYLAVSTVLANMDSYQGNFNHNYYLYEQDGKFTFLAWDHNMSIGGMMGHDENEQIEMLIDEPTVGSVESYPLVDYVLSNDEYKEQYHQYAQESLNLLTDLESQVDELKSLIGEAVKEDPTAFYTYDEFVANTGDEAVDSTPGIVGFMKARIKHVQQQLDGDIASYDNGEGISGGMGGGGKPVGMPGTDEGAESGDMPAMGEGGGPGNMPAMGEGKEQGDMPNPSEGDGQEGIPDMGRVDGQKGMPDMNKNGKPPGMQGTAMINTQDQQKELIIVLVLLALLLCAMLFIDRFKRFRGYKRSRKV